MNAQSRPRLVMSSFDTDAALKATLEALAEHGLEPDDFLLLTRSDKGAPASIALAGNGARSRGQAAAAPADPSDPLAPSMTLFADELARQANRYVLFVAIRDRESEHGVCRILLENATAPVLIRDVPRHLGARNTPGGDSPE